ncbi:MAG: hypothetical protein KDI69_06850 [Xanthomonadales bacterium]|nr:hypothetical protein [Xanthomonadales bacterium]
MRILPSRLGLVLGLSLSFSLHAQPQNHSASWWDPTDSGWNVNTLDQGNGIGPYWFTYDENGKPTWFLGLTEPQADGSYAGEMYRFTGVPFEQIKNGPSSRSADVVGEVRLAFDADPRKLRFTTTIDGVTVSRDLTRFNFSGKDLVCSGVNAVPNTATNYSDVWYETATSGWGINIAHLDETIYAQWHTYDDTGRAVFMSMELQRQADGRYVGAVHRKKDGGRSFQSIAKDGTPPDSEAIGTASLLFLDGNRAELDFVINDVPGHHQLSRLQVGTSANQCEVKPYEVDGGGSSAGDLCMPPYAINDVRTLRSTGTSNGTAGDPFTFTETVTGAATFNGQSGFKITYSSTKYAGDGVYAYNYVGNGNDTTMSFGAEAIDPATKALLSTSKNDPARVELARRFVQGQTVSLDFGVNSTSAAGATRTDIESTYRYIGKESVTVPAGTFNACKFEHTVDLTSTTAGVATHTLSSGMLWSDPQFGTVKIDEESTSTVTAMGYSTTTTTTEKQELLSATMGGTHKP